MTGMHINLQRHRDVYKRQTYDGIAQDFLGMTVPSRADWMKKMTLTEASEKEKESFGHYLAYSAMIPVQAYGTLKKRLEETGMDRLFDEIEMPLVYALYDMEKAGIAVEKDALAEYGSRLTDVYKRQGLYCR